MTATVKLRGKFNFPATVTAEGGFQIVKANGVWTLSPKWDDLTLETTIPDAEARQLWTLDPVNNVYARLSVQALIDNLPEGPPGSPGATGATGPSPGIHQAYSTTTTDADPGAGIFRLNNATPASATAAYLDNVDAAGAVVSGIIDRWDDSTNTIKGFLRVEKSGDATVWGEWNVTGSIVDGTGYRKLTLASGAGSGTFTDADVFAITFTRAGDKGADGAGTGDVVGPAASVDSEVALFNSTTGKLIKRASVSGIAKLTSGVLSAATAGTDYYAPGSTDVALADGGTGSSTAAGALANLTAAGQGKQTIFVPASAMTPRTTNGAAVGSVESTTNKVMSRSLDFDATTQEFAQFSVWFPKSWNLGTVTFQPVFSQLTTAAGGVVFGLAGLALSDADDIDAAFGTPQTSTKTAGTLGKYYIGPESSAITVAGTPTAGDVVVFQINRTVADGSDTLAQDARLHGVRLFYTTNAATDA